MKKILLAAVFILMTTPASAAEIGDVIGTAYYSGIDTYINNYPINAYYSEGRQLICAEELRDFGFNVVWEEKERTLNIEPELSAQIIGQDNVRRRVNMQGRRFKSILYSDIKVHLCGSEIPAYCINGKTMIRIRDLEALGSVEYSAEGNYSKAWIVGMPKTEYMPLEEDTETKPVIVIDPGHGKASSRMTDEEKKNEGYVYHNGRWGEWRHFKNGFEECFGSGCRYSGVSCWYSMDSGDRDTEPDINLQNALDAKYYLETELGYKVRLTRESADENPSFTKRVSYCYPNNDMSLEPDASCYICVHSNAGGGRGSAYIAAEGAYTQKWIDNSYTVDSNRLGECINRRIVIETNLDRHGSGRIGQEGYLILFNKCPVPAGYMEIGFYDSSSDLAVLRTEHDRIGKAIAYGADDFMRE